MTDAATLSLSIVGAATGVAALVSQVWQFRLSGPRVKVTMARADTVPQGHVMLSLDVTNTGRMPVTVLDVGILVEDGRETEFMPAAQMMYALWQGPTLPHRLIDAESATYLLQPSVIGMGLQGAGARFDVKGYARLATGDRIVSANRMDVIQLAQADAERRRGDGAT